MIIERLCFKVLCFIHIMYINHSSEKSIKAFYYIPSYIKSSNLPDVVKHCFTYFYFTTYFVSPLPFLCLVFFLYSHIVYLYLMPYFFVPPHHWPFASFRIPQITVPVLSSISYSYCYFSDSHFFYLTKTGKALHVHLMLCKGPILEKIVETKCRSR